MAIQIRGLKEARDMLGRIAQATRIPRVWIDGLPGQEENKIGWLVKGRKGIQAPRDLLQITPKLTKEMAAALKKGLKETAEGARGDTAWRRAGEVYLEYIQKRIDKDGADIRGKLAKLKPSTIRRKGHARRFYDSGDLLRAIMAARVRVSGVKVKKKVYT